MRELFTTPESCYAHLSTTAELFATQLSTASGSSVKELSTTPTVELFAEQLSTAPGFSAGEPCSALQLHVMAELPHIRVSTAPELPGIGASTAAGL